MNTFANNLRCCLSLSLALFITQALADTPDDPRDYGVFPIVRFQEVKGTAFLIDRQQGWLLTAAHVLGPGVADLTSPTQSVDLLVTSRIDLDQRITFTNTVRASAIAWGYNFFKREEAAAKTTTNDWALLQVLNPSDKTHFNLFREFQVDPALNQNVIQSTARDRRASSESRPLMIAGFPAHVYPVETFFANFLYSFQESTGLWKVSAHVESGSSGGPCSVAGQLYGIVLGSGSSTDLQGTKIPEEDTCNFNPVYSFLPTVAANLPQTEAIKRCATFFALDDQAPGAHEALQALFETMPTLNAVEQWQLLALACSGKRTARHRFIYQYFARQLDKNGWMIDHFTTCLSPVELTALLITNNAILSSAQTAGFSNITPKVRVATTLAGAVIQDRERLAILTGDPKLVSRTVLQGVYAQTTLHGLPQSVPAHLAAIGWASARLGQSPEVSATYLAADKDLTRKQKVQLAEYGVLLATQEGSHGQVAFTANVAEKAVGAQETRAIQSKATTALVRGTFSTLVTKHPGEALVRELDQQTNSWR